MKTDYMFHYRDFITFADTPAIILYGGIFPLTTDPVATTHPSPIYAPPAHPKKSCVSKLILFPVFMIYLIHLTAPKDCIEVYLKKILLPTTTPSMDSISFY